MSTPHHSLVAVLAAVRREAAALVADIDTSVKPRPTRIAPPSDSLPGPVWEPAASWTLRVDDPSDAEPCVFVDHPHIWGGDVIALEPGTARRIGMAFLVAADWADRARSRAVADELTCQEEG